LPGQGLTEDKRHLQPPNAVLGSKRTQNAFADPAGRITALPRPLNCISGGRKRRKTGGGEKMKEKGGEGV